MLSTNIPQGSHVKFRSRDPTEPLAESVVGIHHVPVTSGVRNRNRAFGPVVVPLGHLNEGQHGKQDSKKTLDHWIVAISNSIADFGVSCAISLEMDAPGAGRWGIDPQFGDRVLPWLGPS